MGDLVDGALTKVTGKQGGAVGSGKLVASALTPGEAEGGLREALAHGAVAAVLRVGKVDGFWRDSQIQIPLPKTLARAQSALKPAGLSAPFDDLQLRLNALPRPPRRRRNRCFLAPSNR